jgi:predicted DNA-binding protein
VRKIKTITLRFDDELHKKFKMYSVEKGKTMQGIITELIEEKLKQAETKE